MQNIPKKKTPLTFAFVSSTNYSLSQKYIENVKQDTNVGTNILRVSASDEDADNNGAIIYNLTSAANPGDLDYFEVQPESGWIILKKPLDVSTVQGKHCSLFVRVLEMMKADNARIFTNSSKQKG